MTHTPEVLTDATADLAFTLLLDVTPSNRGGSAHPGGDAKEWAPLFHLGKDVSGSTLGIIGMGRIGRAVAKQDRGFDMKVFYHSRTRLPLEEEKKLGVSYLPFRDLLRQSDFVSSTPPTMTTPII